MVQNLCLIFSKVYWNPRLSTEHERILKILKSGDILYDVFAGVGPFCIPAAKKKCIVLANDLNPESFKWLNTNIEINNCRTYITTFNKDGRDFIIENVKKDLLEKLQSSENLMEPKIHITMNLPGSAVDFLGAFRGLFANVPEILKIKWNLPLIHLYSFIKGEKSNKSITYFVEKYAGFSIENSLEGIYFVRNVAPNKDMYRISFYLTTEILFQNQKLFAFKRCNTERETNEEEISKRICTK